MAVDVGVGLVLEGQEPDLGAVAVGQDDSMVSGDLGDRSAATFTFAR